jgi:hypothetical protein
MRIRENSNNTQIRSIIIREYLIFQLPAKEGGEVLTIP